MNVKLLTLLALGLSIPNAIQAQDSEELGQALKGVRNGAEEVTDLYKKDVATYKAKNGEEFEYNTFTSGSTSVHKFDNNARAFRDWSISLGGGTNFMSRADLTSFYDSKVTPGYNFYASLNKQLTHTFGLSLQYQYGRTTQKGSLASMTENIVYPNGMVAYDVKKAEAGLRGVAKAHTKYHQISLLGDVNLSNLFRRMDNFSPYRWALHAYAGVGLQGFKFHREDEHPRAGYFEDGNRQKFGIASFFYQGGLGLKYNLSKLIDLEARVMYIITGDDEFDGGGWTPEDFPGYNMIKNNDSDNMFTTNLGVTFKLGKKGATHLSWYDPMTEIYYRTQSIGEPRTEVCLSGDNDNDGVCDDWDRQLNTPAGARVDGAGVALDVDLDGVIDLHDKCVTIPGEASNEGCPVDSRKIVKDGQQIDVVESLNKYLDGIEFELNKAVIRPSSYAKLDLAAEVLKELNNTNNKYVVVGATDTRGSVELNRALSQRRSQAVLDYLVRKGVNRNILMAEGRGKSDLKYPECDPASKCPEWKNEANRRVFFEQK